MSLAAGVLTAALALPPQGLVAAYDFTRVNYLSWSEDFTNGVWAKNRIDATPNRITITSNPTGFDYVWQAIPSAAQGQTVTAYVDMMQGNSAVSDLRILTNNGSTNVRSARIRWSDRTLIPHPDGATIGTVTSEERGGGVLRVTITVTLPALTAGTGMFIYPNGWNSTPTAGIYVDVLRAQWQLGSPTGYEKQTDAQVLLDRSVRLWPAPNARTNLLTWSEDFTQSAWTKSRSTVTADGVVSDTTATDAPHELTHTTSGLAINQPHLISARLYPRNGTLVALGVSGARVWSDRSAVFQLTGGGAIARNVTTQANGTAGQTARITPLGDGGYQCELVINPEVANPVVRIMAAYAATGEATSEVIVAGAGTERFRVTRAQLSSGFSVPYEKTTDGVTYDLSQRGMRNLISNSELARTSDSQLPTGWSLQLPSGLSASYSYGLSAAGVPYLQVTLTGAVSSGGQAFNLYMAPTGAGGVPVTPGATYSVAVDAVQVSGPAMALQVGTHQWSTSGTYTGTSGASGPITGAGDEPRRLGGAVTMLAATQFATPRLGATVAWPVESSQTRVYRISQPQLELGSVPTTYQRSPSHGTLGSSSNADSNDPAWTPQGLVFDGVDDFVSVSGVAGETGETLIFRVPSNTNRAGEVATVYSQGQQSGGPTPYLWVYYVSNAITIQLADGQDRVTNSFSTVAPGTLVAITADYASGRIRYYENGTLRSAVTHIRPFLPVRSAVARIGCYSISLTHTASGTQSWLSRHTRALTDAEVHQAYRFIRNQLSRRGVTI